MEYVYAVLFVLGVLAAIFAFILIVMLFWMAVFLIIGIVVKLFEKTRLGKWFFNNQHW